MAKRELETRIAAALTADSIPSADVNTLIEETVAAIAESETVAAAAKLAAFDPALSPDSKQAREQMEDALFEVSRLKALLPRLEAFAYEVRKREEAAAYVAKRDVLQAEGDTIEEDLIQTYRECTARIMDVFQRALVFQNRARRDLPAIPPGVAAFRDFDASVARTLRDVVLVALDGKQQLWPQQSSGSFAADFAQSMVVPYHPGPRWSDPDVQVQRRAAIEKEQEQIAAYHEQAAKAQEERINREERERFTSSRRV